MIFQHGMYWSYFVILKSGLGQKQDIEGCYHVSLEFPYKIPWRDGESLVTGEGGIDPIP